MLEKIYDLGVVDGMLKWNFLHKKIYRQWQRGRTYMYTL